jgi:hypothetical protein
MDVDILSVDKRAQHRLQNQFDPTQMKILQQARVERETKVENMNIIFELFLQRFSIKLERGEEE